MINCACCYFKVYHQPQKICSKFLFVNLHIPVQCLLGTFQIHEMLQILTYSLLHYYTTTMEST